MNTSKRFETLRRAVHNPDHVDASWDIALTLLEARHASDPLYDDLWAYVTAHGRWPSPALVCDPRRTTTYVSHRAMDGHPMLWPQSLLTRRVALTGSWIGKVLKGGTMMLITPERYRRRLWGLLYFLGFDDIDIRITDGGHADGVRSVVFEVSSDAWRRIPPKARIRNYLDSQAERPLDLRATGAEMWQRIGNDMDALRMAAYSQQQEIAAFGDGEHFAPRSLASRVQGPVMGSEWRVAVEETPGIEARPDDHPLMHGVLTAAGLTQVGAMDGAGDLVAFEVTNTLVPGSRLSVSMSDEVARMLAQHPEQEETDP